MVDGQEVDIGLLHRQQEHESVTLIADTCRAPTAMYEGTKTEMKGESVAEQQLLRPAVLGNDSSFLNIKKYSVYNMAF